MHQMFPGCFYHFHLSRFTINYDSMEHSQGEMGKACSTNGGEPERKRPLDVGGGVDNIKMNLREIGWGRMDWIDLAQDRDQWRALLVDTVINFRVP
jgi:hypothetical protein